MWRRSGHPPWTCRPWAALHRAVSKESTARQTLPPVKTFHKIFPRKTLSGIQHEWKLRYSYLQRRKLLCAHCWKDVFQACSSSENVAKKILNRSARNLNTEVISLIFRLERCSPAATSLLVFLFGRGGGGQCPVGNTGHYIKLYLEVRQSIFLSPSTKLYFRSVCFKCNVASLASRGSRQHIFTSLPKSYSQTNCETIFLQLPSPASILSGLY